MSRECTPGLTAAIAHARSSVRCRTSHTPDFYQDVVAGLSRSSKRLPCKYFYDERGSQLFDRICELDEYYPMRAENGIMQEHAENIAARIGSRTTLVEYGSGSSIKTRALLEHLEEPRAYIPVDISEEHLLNTAAQLQREYPTLEVHPVVADFTTDFELPPRFRDGSTTIYFPGSTIGNFDGDAALKLLGRIAEQCRNGGGLLIGIDLEKEEQTLLRAYDDVQGITAEFNLNILHRINRELDGNFDVGRFAHVARVVAEPARVEIYIESLQAQAVRIGMHTFEFRAGELILTEYSHKYQIEGFASLARQVSLIKQAVWTDERDLFAVMHLTRP